ncbi:MAG: anti-sigma factor [Burkholderiales bacterium]|nr:anti-sigma factor [Burkholderiales bacterium]
MNVEHHDPDAVTEAELHAFVDGQLPAPRVEAVNEWLRARPDAAARVAAWQAQRAQLRALHRDVLDEPVPAALRASLEPARSRARFGTGGAARWALAASLLGVGFASGWAVHASRAAEARVDAVATAAPGFVREARLAHVLYTPERRHPVEVGAGERAHLLQWLSKRLDAPLAAPDFSALGYTLMGGRLLPGSNGEARAQFMFESGRDARVTLHVSVLAAETASAAANGGERAFRFATEGNTQTFYWVEGRFGYALSGEVARSELAALADSAYRQLALSGTSAR